MPSRGVTVLVAVVLGVVAAVASYSAVSSAPRQAFHHAKLSTVYVLKGTVPRQESVATAYSEGLIASTLIPTQYVPVGAVRNIDGVREQVAGSELAPGQVLVNGMLVAATNNPGQGADALPAGDVAVSVSVDPAAGVGGAVQPGDRVDVLVDASGTQETYMFQSVLVLAVGTRLVPIPGTTPDVTTDIITFALSPADAAHIPPTTTDSGPITQGVYLALESPGNQPTSVTTVKVSDLIPGLSSSAAVPAGSGATGIRAAATQNVPRPTETNEPTP